MTGDDFINMARQVGMINTPIGQIKALCKMVAAHENEACAMLCDEAVCPEPQYDEMGYKKEDTATHLAESIRSRRKAG